MDEKFWRDYRLERPVHSAGKYAGTSNLWPSHSLLHPPCRLLQIRSARRAYPTNSRNWIW